jgi:hypothetical protein
MRVRRRPVVGFGLRAKPNHSFTAVGEKYSNRLAVTSDTNMTPV